ncbi:MAG: hypothetical protein QGG36_15595 [Pirellulaceae bacterium]|jgi:predicted acetyltransferase|nr:hypothetical protein [Pirellulaceae bacterium]MDP7017229.1 hypothetical protein [Pirellulaceae bacterium]
MRVELQSAADTDEPWFAENLAQYYQELSSFSPWLMDTAFGLASRKLPTYWRRDDRHPLILKAAAPSGAMETVGLALVDQSSPPTDLEEFYILADYRRRGFGKHLAHDLFLAFPGDWQVRVRNENSVADSFWKTTIASFTNDVVTISQEADNSTWTCFRFPADANAE